MAESAAVGGVTYTSNSKTPYVDIYNQYAKNLENQINTYKQNQETQRLNDVNKLNSAYDANARQYYIQSQQAQKGLNSRLASQGINGGASESAMLRMSNAYGQNIAKNETGRQGDITNTNNTYASALSDYLAEQEANRMNTYNTMMQNQAEYEEKQRDKDLQNFAASITNRFNKKSGYQNLIKELQASSDPLKAEKIALVQQAMVNWQLANKGSGGGGGRSYGGYSSGGNSSGGGGGNTTGSAGTWFTNSVAKAANSINAIAKNIKK